MTTQQLKELQVKMEAYAEGFRDGARSAIRLTIPIDDNAKKVDTATVDTAEKIII